LKTYFAASERATSLDLENQINAVCNHALIDTLMTAFGGIVLVLNGHRQIVAANAHLFEYLGLGKADLLFGLRPGEALSCIHSKTMSAGCGTSRACRSCGAVLAILACQEQGTPTEMECCVVKRSGEQESSYDFWARAFPLRIEQSDFVVLALRDIRSEKYRESLERVFFHDLNNLVGGMVGLCSCLEDGAVSDDVLTLCRGVERMADEIRTQRQLMKGDLTGYSLSYARTTPDQIIKDSIRIAEKTEEARGKSMKVLGQVHQQEFVTDVSLLRRVLLNMIKNALEATDKGGVVRIWSIGGPDGVVFSVWNALQIPDDEVSRVFQRYFSTKSESGRGLGTYSMKLIGERLLAGKVEFSTEEDGTIFSIHLPKELKPL
jgi:K+-sensing histidine kinase KdpD